MAVLYSLELLWVVEKVIIALLKGIYLSFLPVNAVTRLSANLKETHYKQVKLLTEFVSELQTSSGIVPIP